MQLMQATTRHTGTRVADAHVSCVAQVRQVPLPLPVVWPRRAPSGTVCTHTRDSTPSPPHTPSPKLLLHAFSLHPVIGLGCVHVSWFVS
jgi:hypothetical protein